MNEKALAHTSPAAHEQLARPKVMRRPAQFSAAQPPAAIAEVAATLPIIRPVPEQPAVRPAPSAAVASWSQDGRFAAVLITLLALLNIAAYYALGHRQADVVPVPPTLLDATSPHVHVLDDKAPAQPAQEQ